MLLSKLILILNPFFSGVLFQREILSIKCILIFKLTVKQTYVHISVTLGFFPFILV